MEEFYVFSGEAVRQLCEKEPRFKKVLSGYKGEVAHMKISSKSMLVPNILGLAKKIDFMWAFVAFGFSGSTKAERVIASEINKCLSGKIYSVKKLADAYNSL